MPFVYILECADKTLYTGWTVNLEKRLEAHLQGKASKYTRARLPVKFVYTKKMPHKKEAMKLEYAIKKMSRADKLKLVYFSAPDPADTLSRFKTQSNDHN